MPNKINNLRHFQTRFTLWHVFADVILGNAISKDIRTDQIFYHVGAQTTAAINNTWSQSMHLHRGTYALKMLYEKTVNSGILTLSLNSATAAVPVATQDLYNATTLANQQLAVTGIIVAQDALWFLTGEMLSKNASSGGYQAWLTCIDFYRTGD